MPWVLLAGLLLQGDSPQPYKFEVEAERRILVGGTPFRLTIKAVGADGEVIRRYRGPARVTGLLRTENGKRVPVEWTGGFQDGRAVLEKVLLGGRRVTVQDGAAKGSWEPDRIIPGVLSLAPAALAIVLAIVTRQVLLALFSGIWLGAWLLHWPDPLKALLSSLDTYLVGQLVDAGHVKILLFTLALGGMVGIVNRSGGTKGLVDAISVWARDRRSGMLSTWAMGIAVFFDDYANCLLVGSTIRPLTDKLRISREKLAYLIDSTAAPVAAVALISTWIGYEISQFQDIVQANGREPYDVFLGMIPYRFYAIFTLFFVFLIAVTRRDFGPMLRAERRAVEKGEPVRPGGKPLMDRELTETAAAEGVRPCWQNAVFPIIGMILIVPVGLYWTGVKNLGDAAEGARLRDILSEASSYDVLIWAAAGGGGIALILALGTRALNLSEALASWVTGCRSMVLALLILALAWTIGDLCEDKLWTGRWLMAQVHPGPAWMPLIVFIVSSLIALATGTSWGTMALVIPIAAPMVFAATQGDAAGWMYRVATLAAVLDGAVYGDHCSPISDTTILSSIGAASDHIDHVRTQLPYGTLCAAVAALVGYGGMALGFVPLITLPIGCAVLGAVLLILGRRVGTT